MKFKFDLERVLNYREILTDKALANYQRQFAIVKNQLDLIEGLQQQILDGYHQNQEKIKTAGSSSGFLQTNSDLIAGLRAKTKIEHRKLRSLQVELEDLKEILLKKKREQRSLELLKDRKHQSFLKQRAKKEQKAMDDLAVMRHAVKGEP